VKALYGSSKSFLLTGSTRKDLPWEITGLQVTFSEPIVTASAASLTGITATGFSGLGTNTLTWTFSPIAQGSITAKLSGSGASPISAGTGGALGNGAGFTQAFKVLWGDYNADGAVNATDATILNNFILFSTYNIYADINGDGAVNSADLVIVQTRQGTSIQ
jgi:hypothetical protein